MGARWVCRGAGGGVIFNCLEHRHGGAKLLAKIRKLPGNRECAFCRASRRAARVLAVCPKVCGGPGWAWAHVACAAALFCFAPPPPPHTHAHHNPRNSLSLSLSPIYPSFLVRAPSASRHSVQYKMFVCHICKSALQSFSIRVKSVSMSTFDIDEVKGFAAKRGGGNEACRAKWFGKLDDDDDAWPLEGDSLQTYKNFIERAFLNEEWLKKGKSSRGNKKHKKDKKKGKDKNKDLQGGASHPPC